MVGKCWPPHHAELRVSTIGHPLAQHANMCSGGDGEVHAGKQHPAGTHQSTGGLGAVAVRRGNVVELAYDSINTHSLSNDSRKSITYQYTAQFNPVTI